jgi:hypothetical protein
MTMSEKYEARVQALEAEDMTRSDAQAIADMEFFYKDGKWLSVTEQIELMGGK